MAEDTKPTGLNAFMERVLGWIPGLESKFTSLETAVSKLASTQDQLTQAQNDLATARLEIGSLGTKIKALETENAELKARDEAVQKQAREMDAEITRRANLMAGERLSKVGVGPAVSEETNANPLTSSSKNMTWTERCLAANQAKARK